jgi:uncharacterized protein (TIGR00299 family) protein
MGKDNKGKILHFDCSAGICGEMILGALLDLGVDRDALLGELGKLGLPGWRLEIRAVERNGIAGTQAAVRLDDSRRSCTPWREIRTLIANSPIPEGARRRALDIFTRIAEAEAQVHGVPVEETAFHEVGALDSIIDITGAAICLDLLAPAKITCGEIELGGGTVRCAHGLLPVPTPATALIVRGLPVKTGGFDREMTTPTGAAFLASSVDEFVRSPAGRELASGAGFGGLIFPDRPDALRVCCF